MASAAPKITLYTNHICPYAHRAHITLKELNLPYEEVLIDLTKPREPWYLEDINPRGLVPSIKYSDAVYKDEIITESAIVARFLADSHPSSLLPATDSKGEPRAALLRARIAFFTDTWDSKVAKYMMQGLASKSAEEKAGVCAEWIAALEKDIEPLLKDAAPFFGGSKDLTMAEVHIAPWILRAYALARDGELPPSLLEGFGKLPNWSRWTKAVSEHPSVLGIWDEERFVTYIKARLQKQRDEAAAAASK